MRAGDPAGRRHRRSGSSPAWLGAATVGLAALILALVLALPGGSPGAPSVSEAAGLGLRPATQKAPAPSPVDPYLLAAHVDGLAFPTWRREGLAPSGQRSDRLGAHRVMTVFYRGRDARLAYSIVSSPALSQPGGRSTRLGGYTFHAFTVGGRAAITWRELGHTCVLSASGVPASTLERLAARTI
jgi:hypothetical protein